jgi:hypothetical protein
MHGLGRTLRTGVADRIQRASDLRAVLLAFADGARFLQHGPAALRSLIVISIEPLLPWTNPARRFAVPRG